MQNVHEEQNDGSNKRDQNAHYSHVRPNYVAHLQNLVNHPLQFRHVSLLNELILYHTILYLPLREVYIVWKEF